MYLTQYLITWLLYNRIIFIKKGVQKYKNASEVIIKLKSFSLLVHNANGVHVLLQICMTSKCNKTKHTVWNLDNLGNCPTLFMFILFIPISNKYCMFFVVVQWSRIMSIIKINIIKKIITGIWSASFINFQTKHIYWCKIICSITHDSLSGLD